MDDDFPPTRDTKTELSFLFLGFFSDCSFKLHYFTLLLQLVTLAALHPSESLEEPQHVPLLFLPAAIINLFICLNIYQKNKRQSDSRLLNVNISGLFPPL